MLAPDVAQVEPFVASCLAAGFVADPERWFATRCTHSRVDAQFVRWQDGTLWLAIPGADVLTAKGMLQPTATRRLADFVQSTTARPDPVADVPRGQQRFVQRSLFE